MDAQFMIIHHRSLLLNLFLVYFFVALSGSLETPEEEVTQDTSSELYQREIFFPTKFFFGLPVSVNSIPSVKLGAMVGLGHSFKCSKPLHFTFSTPTTTHTHLPVRTGSILPLDFTGSCMMWLHHGMHASPPRKLHMCMSVLSPFPHPPGTKMAWIDE